MAVKLPMGAVIAKDPAIVVGTEKGVDVSKIVSRHFAVIAHPNLPAQNASAVSPGKVKPFIHDLPHLTSHDLQYHV
jgi:hypothetical protein